MPTEAASPTNEICTKPKELLHLYNQWKTTQPDLLAERRIIEPLRIFTFGIHLAQEVFPISKKFPYPPITIDQTGKVASADLLVVDQRAKEIALNKSWLLNPTEKKSSSTSTLAFENEGTFRLITAGVEDYAHWILHLAIEKRRSSEYIASLDTHYQKGLDELEESLNLDRAILALSEHLITIEEYMGIVWRNAVAQRYFPWTSTAKRTIDELATVTSYKRELASKKPGLRLFTKKQQPL